MLPKFSYTYFSILLYSIQFCKIINFIPSCFDHDHLKNISIPGRISYFEEIFNPGFQSTYGFPDEILIQILILTSGDERDREREREEYEWLPCFLPLSQIAHSANIAGEEKEKEREAEAVSSATAAAMAGNGAPATAGVATLTQGSRI